MQSVKFIITALVLYSVLNTSFNSLHVIRPITLPDSAILVPLGGNTWCNQTSMDSNYITRQGIKNWNDEKVSFDTYVRMTDTGNVKVQLKARNNSFSQLKLEINGKANAFTIKSSDYSWYDAGEWKITDTGYIKLHLSALLKTGSLIGEVSDFRLSGTAINSKTAFVQNDSDHFFYWGRRGPSVHLNYPFADSIKATWFYNEVLVPESQDVIVSYYMAIGFADGYLVSRLTPKLKEGFYSQFGVHLLQMIPEVYRKICVFVY